MMLLSVSRSGYTCVAVDMPGRGRSDFLASPELYAYPTYLKDITTLLAAIDSTKDVYYVGTSMGGIIGTLIVIIYLFD
jgi:pimeloyl-ACP methyl ester carboxylesterase